MCHPEASFRLVLFDFYWGNIMFRTHHKIYSLLLAIILSLSLVSGLPAEVKKQEEPGILTSVLARPAIGCLYLLTFLMKAPDKIKESLKKQFHPASLLINFIHQYSQWWSSTLCHEAGHSLVHRYLTGKTNTIHLGYSSNDKHRKPWLTIGNVAIEGIDPLAGHTHIEFELSSDDIKKINEFIITYAKEHNIKENTINQETIKTILTSPDFKTFKESFDTNKKKYAAILLAGGSVGILGHHLLKLMFNGKKEALAIDPITINNFFNMLIPIDQNSDAAQLYKDCLGISSEVINNFVFFGQLLHVLTISSIDCYQSYNDNQTTTDASFYDRLMIALANFYLMGYLRFHA